MIRFKNRVVALSTLVHYIYLTCRCISKHEECVTEHIHLENSFINIHRTHNELLMLDYLIVRLVVNRLCKCLLKGSILQLLFNLCFILADLSDNLIYGVIKCCIFINSFCVSCLYDKYFFTDGGIHISCVSRL